MRHVRHIAQICCVALITLAAISCASSESAEDDVIDLGDLGDGKSDGVFEHQLKIEPGQAATFRARTSGTLLLRVEQAGEVPAQIVVLSRVGTAAPTVSETAVTPRPELRLAAGAEIIKHDIAVHNEGTTELRGTLIVDDTPCAGCPTGGGGSAMVVTGTSAELKSRVFEGKVNELRAQGWKLDTISYNDNVDGISAVVLLERNGKFTAEVAPTADIGPKVSELVAAGWKVRLIDHRRIANACIVWVAKPDFSAYRAVGMDASNLSFTALKTAASEGFSQTVKFIYQGPESNMALMVKGAELKLTDDEPVGDVMAQIQAGFKVVSLEAKPRSGSSNKAAAWLKRNTEVKSLVAATPQALEASINELMRLGWKPDDLGYSGTGSVAWVTKDDTIKAVVGANADELAKALGPQLSAGWIVQQINHNGPEKVAAWLHR